MAWNIDDARVNGLAIRRGQIQFGKTELNGDLPRFFLRQAIRIRSSERFHQRALAMIDMARRRNDEMASCHTAPCHHEGHEAHEGLQDKALNPILQLRDVEIDQ